MNTTQIYKILKGDQALKQTFTGVYPIDQLPLLFSKPSALVVNLDTSKQTGSHWVALFFDSVTDTGEYFDSFGREPNSILLNYIQKFASKIKYNKKCLQNILSSTCGQMCLFYLLWRVRGVSLKLIGAKLEKGFADELVTSFINSLFKINTVVIDKQFLLDQIS